MTQTNKQIDKRTKWVTTSLLELLITAKALKWCLIYILVEFLLIHSWDITVNLCSSLSLSLLAILPGMFLTGSVGFLACLSLCNKIFSMARVLIKVKDVLEIFFYRKLWARNQNLFFQSSCLKILVMYPPVCLIILCKIYTRWLKLR